MLRLFSRFLLLALVIPLSLLCQTGSNYEKLKKKPSAEVAVPAAAPPLTYVIRPLTFTAMPDRTEMYRKAFIVPGYKGIDFDGYGRMAASDEKTGMRTLYSTPDMNRVLSEELNKLELKTIAGTEQGTDAAALVDIHVRKSETSLRMHTYGCWLFVGFFVYLVNGDVYTVLAESQLDYTIAIPGKPARQGTLTVYSEKDFGFWTTYAGFEVLESFEEGQKNHFKDIALKLSTVLKQP